MAMEEAPIVGAVYEDEEGKTFEVTGFDEDEGLIEIEHEDGTADEIDIDSWYGLDLERISDAEEEDEEDVGLDYDEDDYDEDLDEDEDSDEEEEES